MHNAYRQIRERYSLGTIIAVIVALYIAFYLLQTVTRNYQMQREISALREQITNLQVEQDQLRYRIQYYQTENYKEKEARAKLGLQAPGESVVMLPNDKSAETEPPETGDKEPKTAQSNPQQWLNFLLGRP